jgi:integrase
VDKSPPAPNLQTEIQDSAIDEVSSEKLVEQFLASRNSNYTRRNYTMHLPLVVGDPVEFLDLAAISPKRAKFKIIDWITSHKEKADLESSTMQAYLTGVKSLCDYAELALPWKQIYSTLPKPIPADKKAPPFRAVRKIYELVDLRQHVILGVFLSGCRVGAFSYLVRKPGERQNARVTFGFQLGDLSQITVDGVQIGRIVIYRGEHEEYVSFLTPETMANIHGYLEFRRRYGEVLSPTSPLIRKAFNFRELDRPAKKLTKDAIQHDITQLWFRAGYPAEKRDWPICHGFRKYAETRLWCRHEV